MMYKEKKLTFKKTKENTFDAFHGEKFIGCVTETIEGIKFYAINGQTYKGRTKTIAAGNYVLNNE